MLPLVTWAIRMLAVSGTVKKFRLAEHSEPEVFRIEERFRN
jgi:hypothetical protein